MESKEILDIVNSALNDKKAMDIVDIDITDKSTIADYFVVCTGTSTTHIKALADEVEEALGNKGVVLHHSEGYQEGRWILLDYSTVIVHIFHQEEREYYDIEKLWENYGGIEK